MGILYLEPLPQRATKVDLLKWLESTGGVDRQRVGKIELHARRAAIELPNGWETRLAKALDGQSLNNRRMRAWCESALSIPMQSSDEEDHFLRLAQLLNLESQAEADRVLERARQLSPNVAEQSGNALLDLVIIDEDTGLGGRYLLRLAKRKRNPLPWNRLDVGMPVVLSPDKARRVDGTRGVVFERSESGIGIAVSSLPDGLEDENTWRLDVSNDEAAAQRQRIALDRARTARAERLAQLRAVLLGIKSPEFLKTAPPLLFAGEGRGEGDYPPNSSLNVSQQEAVRFALSARDVALIQGPPGTGKTTAVVELIRRAVQRGEKVLACAPSNLAVDNIFERLLATGEHAIRLGHPARVLPQLRQNTLDLLVEEHPDVRLARKLVKEALVLFRRADRYTRAKPEPGARREAREEARSLLTDARRLELQAADQILNHAAVVCATTTGLDSEILGTRRFDLAVIDEACQSTEPGCWIPLLRCERIVLSGDHCQLSPTVVSPEAAAQGFGISLFERLMTLYGPAISRRLTVQYRMHESIMQFSAQEFYDGELQADDSVAHHLLVDLPDVKSDALTTCPIEFIDTAGAGFDEEQEPDGESRLNRGEAEFVGRKVRALLDCGLEAGHIAVISPYAAQVRLLRERLNVPGIEIDSVDGFQGREKEAVVISLVRSNAKGEIGFLSDVRRMNVALTRARRKLLVIGDSATLASDPFYQRLIEYFEAQAAYHTVWEEGIDV